MSEGSNETRKWIAWFLTVLLVLAIFASFYYVLTVFFLPTPEEYDDYYTKKVQESFPWNPHIVSNFTGARDLLGMGVLRHLAVLPEHLGTLQLIAIVGRVFFVLFINRIRETFLDSKRELDFKVYIEWGIGSIVGAIIYVAGSISTRREIELAQAGILLALASLILYLTYFVEAKRRKELKA